MGLVSGDQSSELSWGSVHISISQNGGIGGGALQHFVLANWLYVNQV